MSDTEKWLNWNGELNNPGESKDNREADDESNMELGTSIKSSERPQHQVLSAATNLVRLIRPTRRSMKQAEQGLITVSSTKTWRNMGNKKR